MNTTKFAGKTLRVVYLRNKAFECETRMPGADMLFNFDVNNRWLVLDDYGNDELPELLVDRIFGRGTYIKGYTVAIDKSTGQCYFATLSVEEGRNCLHLNVLPMVVPAKWLPRLDELKSCKRPFYRNSNNIRCCNRS